ncbi:sulfite exporter TauE/SafE family protein [Shewanella gelidii]|uniref:Probable membrane transporter protein n=1 Tax=Shewanella gelidii TaxID=1642821 RepID=A0A917JHQ1_9GAMM|nr:sulfite exporter TauE/SafE family protein [Shewanella gelidii]MCL1096680.1 sulfite exporter TauE/SafE family protein [Shewanella gelidii]GGI69468.1 UPF0721 transmembrane protein [Shewanella gelidii]
MESLITVFICCVVLGSFVGFMAGLLGIGGGLIIVPALLYILPFAGIEVAYPTHIAIATSLAAIILTSASSARAHHKRGNIPWELFKPMLPGIILGAIVAGSISELISAEDLKRIFAVFVVLMAIQMAFPFKSEVEKELPGKPVLFAVSMCIALIAGLMGIGGGVLLVPYLTWSGLQMRKAVGFSSATGLMIASSGTIGYIIAGWDVTDLPTGAIGFIYLPALVGIVVTSMLTAPLGVKAASTWPTPVLKKIFAVLLAVIGLKLMLS